MYMLITYTPLHAHTALTAQPIIAVWCVCRTCRAGCPRVIRLLTTKVPSVTLKAIVRIVSSTIVGHATVHCIEMHTVQVFRNVRTHIQLCTYHTATHMYRRYSYRRSYANSTMTCTAFMFLTFSLRSH